MHACLLAVRSMGIVAGWGRFPLVGAPGDVGAAVEERIGFIEDWRAGARRDVGGGVKWTYRIRRRARHGRVPAEMERPSQQAWRLA